MIKHKWYAKPIYVLVALALVLSLGIVAVPTAGMVEAESAPHVSGVANGDYIHFGGCDWIMLDNTTGYVILKDASSIPKQTDPIWMTGPFEEHCRAFDYEYKKINARQEWDTNERVASLNEWLNETFYNDLDDDKAFVADGTWNIEAGHPDASATAYDWTGKVALLTKTEFEYFRDNGPDLHGTATKAINNYTFDPNMDTGWWLLTPGPGTNKVAAVYFVQWCGPWLDNAGAHNKQVRPTLYLTSGLTTSGGDGSSENPFVVYAPPPTVPMSKFEIDHAKIDFKKKADDDKVRVQGKLVLDLDKGDGVDIVEDVIVIVGPLSETITMVEKGKKGEKWQYKRPKGGTGNIKHMTINWKNGKFDIRMDKAELSELTDPAVTISVQIGDDLGEETITMREKKHHWDYKAK